MSAPEDHLLLYDADCGFCKWCVNRLLVSDRDRRLRPVAIRSDEGARALASMPVELRLRSAHLVTPNGAILSGGRAAPEIMALLPRGAPVAAVLRLVPGFIDRGYRFIADHRITISRALGTQGTQLRDRREA